MKYKRLLLLIPVFAISMLSCQKEADLQNDSPGTGGGGGPVSNTQNILGDYNFVSIAGDTRTSATVSDPLGSATAIGTSSYQSTNNSGTVKITSSQFAYTNIAYAINTTLHAQLYLGTILLSESDMPYVVDPTPITGTENYTKNSNDSLTFSNALFVAQSPYGSNINPAPMGAKLSWAGDTLIMKINHTFTGTVTNQQGQPAAFTGTFKGTLKLKKK